MQLERHLRCLVRANLKQFRLLHESRATHSTYSQAASEVDDADRSVLKKAKAIRKRQKRLPFVDEITMQIKAGAGGNGCVAFHREAGVPHGGPSGGNGGIGGSIYFQPSEDLTNLASVERIVRAENGGNGKGSWQHGVRARDTIIKVPLGTQVREIRSHPLRECCEETPEERMHRLFLHYPNHEEDMQFAHSLKRVEKEILAEEKRQAKLRNLRPSLLVDFTHDMPAVLAARGGLGGFGNAVFASNDHKLPKFATKGKPGEELTVNLELKLIADVGLVGFPNVGKSSLIQGLTNSKSLIAPYAFTTLSPHLGIVALNNDQTLQRYSEDDADGLSRLDRESFRFSIADCPGLLPDAASNGLGSAFLRHLERARLLVYVVDLSRPNPELELEVLRKELEAHKEGLSSRAKLIIANKADLVPPSEDSASKMKRLGEWIGSSEATVLTSAQRGGNLNLVAARMKALLVAESANAI